MNCFQFPLGSFLKINFPWSKPGGFIAASMLARHVWCGNFTVTLGIHTGSKQRVTREWILKFTWDLNASCLLKSATFRCYSECTQINVESLQIRKMYWATFICMTKNDGDFKSKWAHRSLSCANALPHKHFNSAHFSRLTSYWAAM